MIMIIIIIIIIKQLILGDNCYIASTQRKLTDTQEVRFSSPRNVQCKRGLNLSMKRSRWRRRRRRRKKGR
jgi:hypothetical protein